MFVSPSQLLECLTQCEDKLKSLEQANGVCQRWSTSSTQYQEAKALVASEHRMCLIKTRASSKRKMVFTYLKGKIFWYSLMLSFLAIGRLTLLRLFICMHITDLCPSILSTYHSVPLKLCTISFIFAVDGLAIASRLSKRVSAVNNQIKKMLRSFNEGLPVEDHMIWEAAINIHRNSYTASLASIATSIPIEVKREAVQKFRTAKRSEASTENHFPLTSYTGLLH